MISKISFITFVFSLANAVAKNGNNWNVPSIERPKQHETTGRPLNVAITALLPGMSMLKQRDIARGLSEEIDQDGAPLFNVTLIAAN